MRFAERAGGVGEKSRGWETTRALPVRGGAEAGRDFGVGLGMAERPAGGEVGVTCSWWWEVRIEGICGGIEAGCVVERR
jgi:hypothetical protein